MSGGLYTANAQEAREDFLRLKGVELSVPTDEQLAKMRADNPDIPAHIQMVVTWEPLSYRIEGGKYGNQEADYIRMSKGDGLSKLESVSEQEALANIRAGGYPAVPSAALIKLARGLEKKDPAKMTRPYERFMVAAAKLGIHLDIDLDGSKTGKPGSLYSNDVGKVFKCTAGFEEFPTPGENEKGQFRWNWDETTSRFMRIPVARADDYVQPEEVPVRVIESSDDGEKVQAAAAAQTVDTSDALRNAISVMGLVGTDVESAKSTAKGVALRSISKAPVLGSAEVMAALNAGTFIEYAEGKGVITTAGGVIELVA